MKNELVLLPSEHVKEAEKFEFVFKSAIENYLRNYSSNYRQILKSSIKYK